MEIWKPVRDFEEYYAVSNMGRVKSLARTIVALSRWGGTYRRTLRERIMSPVDNGTGYLQVRLDVAGNRVARYIHRMVAEAFVERTEDDLEVDHVDSDKTNNCSENLRWVSRKENMLKCIQENPHVLENLR